MWVVLASVNSNKLFTNISLDIFVFASCAELSKQAAQNAMLCRWCCGKCDAIVLRTVHGLGSCSAVRCCVCALVQVLALEMLILLLENPSDDSVEMAVDFCKEVR